MIIQERLDPTTLKELTRLAEERERRARRAGDSATADRWFNTAEWLRSLQPHR